MSDDGTRLFTAEFDDEFAVGADSGNKAFFGRNVLRGLIAGIEDSAETLQSRFRSLGPALLGSALWIDDEELLATLADLSAACIVVSKQGRNARDRAKLERLQRANDATPGLPIGAFPDLGLLAPKVDGQRLIVGPYGPRFDDTVLPTIRTIGYRKSARRDLPPIVHAKLALLGHMWWHDEGPLGHVDDVIGFTPFQLWISSANFTNASRRSLEFGYWTEDDALMKGAERFLIRLIAASEGLDPDADAMDPDLAEIEFDDEAMWEAMADHPWDDGEDGET